MASASWSASGQQENLSGVRGMVIHMRQWEAFGRTFTGDNLEKQEITEMINFMCKPD